MRILLISAMLTVTPMGAMELAIPLKEELNNKLFELVDQGKLSASQIAAFIEQGASVNARRAKDGMTLLHIASNKGNKDLVGALIAKSADCWATSNSGSTPLHLAAGGGYTGIVEILLAQNANVNAVDADGRTPLHKAAVFGHKELVAVLLKEGADVNAMSRGGRTPLYMVVNSIFLHGKEAISQNYQELIAAAEVLLAYGAHVNLSDDKGVTPLDKIIDLFPIYEEHCYKIAKDAIHDAYGMAKNLVMRGACLTRMARVWWPLSHFPDVSSVLISNLFIIPDFDDKVLSDARLRIATALWCLKKCGIRERELRSMILSKESSLVEDMLRVLLLRMVNGIGRNSLAEYMKSTPFEVRTVFVAHMFAYTVKRLKVLMKSSERENRRDRAFLFTSLTSDNLENHVGKVLIDNICERLGFVKIDADVLANYHEDDDWIVTEKDLNQQLFALLQRDCVAASEVAGLLLQGADVHALDHNSTGTLHMAACFGHKEIVELLISRGVEVNVWEGLSWTARNRLASFNPGDSLIEFAYEDERSLENQVLRRTPLHCAAQSGHLEIVQLLLERGAKIDEGAAGAAKEISVETDVGKKFSGDVLARTALQWAAKMGYLNVIDFLIEQGADVNAVNFSHETALGLAALMGHFEICSRLLEKGARVTSELAQAVGLGHKDIVVLLLDHGACVDSELNQAVVRGDTDIVDLLLKHGGTIEKDTLLEAAMSGVPVVVFRMLYDAGNDMILRLWSKDMFMHEKPQLLHVAAITGNDEMIQFLLNEAKVKVESKTESGNTALHCAFVDLRKGSPRRVIINLLLEWGLSPFMQNDLGETVLHVAAKKKNWRNESNLLLKGAVLHKFRENGRPSFGRIFCAMCLFQRLRKQIPKEIGNKILSSIEELRCDLIYGFSIMHQIIKKAGKILGNEERARDVLSRCVHEHLSGFLLIKNKKKEIAYDLLPPHSPVASLVDPKTVHERLPLLLIEWGFE